MGRHDCTVPQALGQRLREIREGRGFTTKEVGRAVGVSQQQISRLELGMVNIPSQLLARLAAVYGVTPAQVWFGIVCNTRQPLPVRQDCAGEPSLA